MVVNTQPIQGYYSGDTRRLIVTTIDSDENNVDLTNADSITYIIVDRDGNTVLTKTLQDGIAFLDAQQGRFVINIEPSDTEDLSGQFEHECEIVDQNDDVTTVFTGTVEILEDKIE
jgi:hypothetical protein